LITGAKLVVSLPSRGSGVSCTLICGAGVAAWELGKAHVKVAIAVTAVTTANPNPNITFDFVFIFFSFSIIDSYNGLAFKTNHAIETAGCADKDHGAIPKETEQNSCHIVGRHVTKSSG